MATECRICGNSKDNHPVIVREMMFGTGESFEYLQCSHCNTLQLLQLPHDLSKYYQSNYYSLSNDPSKEGWIAQLLHNLRADQSLKKTLLGKYLLRIFPNHALEALSNVQHNKSTGILDVGCGTGSLIYWLRQIGFKNLLGVDPFIEEDILYHNGVEVKKVSLEGVSGLWDVIMLYHSFEHMEDPLAAMRSISSLLSNDGTCILAIPTVSSYAWETYGPDWVQLDAPRHFFLHSVEGLHILANRAGLTIAKMIYNSTDFQFWGSEQYQRDIPLFSEVSYVKNRSKSIFRGQQINHFKKMAFRLNQENRGDQLVAYLRRKSNSSAP